MAPPTGPIEDPPWEHPAWYDLHDTAHTAGSEREPEHYRELLLALPALDRDDHLVDVGAGTGKLAGLIAKGYPRLGAVTLIEPNEPKLVLGAERLRALLPEARIATLAAGLGTGAKLPAREATIVTVGSVFMPIMLLRGGNLAGGLAWARKGLEEIRGILKPGAPAFLLETLGLLWDRGGPSDPVRRLSMPEWVKLVEDAGFEEVECVYRFRDRVTLHARAPG